MSKLGCQWNSNADIYARPSPNPWITDSGRTESGSHVLFSCKSASKRRIKIVPESSSRNLIDKEIRLSPQGEADESWGRANDIAEWFGTQIICAIGGVICPG